MAVKECLNFPYLVLVQFAENTGRPQHQQSLIMFLVHKHNAFVPPNCNVNNMDQQ